MLLYTGKMLTNLFSAMLLFSGISLVRGYSQGAPAQQQVCYQRTPGHQNTMAQQSQAPFQIIVTPNYYVPCQTAQQCMPITVTIRSGGQMGMVGGMTQGMMGYNFMGFMVQAKTMQPTNQQASPSYGQFAGDGQTSKLLNCGNMGQAITHTSNYNKNQVTFRWRPQPGLNGPIVFMGTVVLKFDTYWTNVMSQQIMPRQGMGQTTLKPRIDPSRNGTGSRIEQPGSVVPQPQLNPQQRGPQIGNPQLAGNRAGQPRQPGQQSGSVQQGRRQTGNNQQGGQQPPNAQQRERQTGNPLQPGQGVANAQQQRTQFGGNPLQQGQGVANAQQRGRQTGNPLQPGQGVANAQQRTQFGANPLQQGQGVTNAQQRGRQTGNPLQPGQGVANAQQQRTQFGANPLQQGQGVANAQQRGRQTGNPLQLGQGVANAQQQRTQLGGIQQPGQPMTVTQRQQQERALQIANAQRGEQRGSMQQAQITALSRVQQPGNNPNQQADLGLGARRSSSDQQQNTISRRQPNSQLQTGSQVVTLDGFPSRPRDWQSGRNNNDALFWNSGTSSTVGYIVMAVSIVVSLATGFIV